MTRRAAYRLSFVTGHVDLCPDCHAVLTREGEVAGDPREPMLTLEGWTRTAPAPIGTPCDICAGLEAYEEALNSSLIRVVEVGPPMALTAHGLIPLDAIPTLAELEGEDMPPQESAAWDSYHADSDVPAADDEAGLNSY